MSHLTAKILSTFRPLNLDMKRDKNIPKLSPTPQECRKIFQHIEAIFALVSFLTSQKCDTPGGNETSVEDSHILHIRTITQVRYSK